MAGITANLSAFIKDETGSDFAVRSSRNLGKAALVLLIANEIRGLIVVAFMVERFGPDLFPGLL